MNNWHVVVVGGGAAGMMAAGQAAELGAKTLLIEKMNSPGRKLRITGKGRCNLTNIAPLPQFISHFGKNGKFLRQTFHHFFTNDLLDFFHKLNVPTITERGGRVFPASEDAVQVVDAYFRWVRQNNVTIQLNTSVRQILTEGKQAVGVEVEITEPKTRAKKIQQIPAETVIVATGGSSYFGTGSTGDGYRWAEALGHKIEPIHPALVPLVTPKEVVPRLQGLSLKNVNVSLWIDGRKNTEMPGEMLFTHFGLSGPVILTISKIAVEALQANQKVEVAIDLKPALDHPKLDARLLREIDEHGKRKFHTMLRTLLPGSLIPVFIDLLGIPEDKACHQISASERKKIRLLLKEFRIPVTGHRPLNEAIITAGGVSLKEIDPRTMGSRLIENLYFAGEVLDIDADTGGYNLQAAFSTGWLAGRSAAESV